MRLPECRSRSATNSSFGRAWAAVHTGSAANFDHPNHDHIDFGSRILFEPEIGAGFRISDSATIEASWVHMSHAQIFGEQNAGIDNFGARLSWRL
jgi:hypothetical protein